MYKVTVHPVVRINSPKLNKNNVGRRTNAVTLFQKDFHLKSLGNNIFCHRCDRHSNLYTDSERNTHSISYGLWQFAFRKNVVCGIQQVTFTIKNNWFILFALHQRNVCCLRTVVAKRWQEIISRETANNLLSIYEL